MFILDCGGDGGSVMCRVLLRGSNWQQRKKDDDSSFTPPHSFVAVVSDMGFFSSLVLLWK